MELSNLEEHFEEAKRGEEGRAGGDTGLVPDPEQERIQAQREEAEQRKPDTDEPDAREGAASGQGGPGF